ncbi:helix-turn-helix domain-containing protein [Halosimplex marinum]|uniref:helix-turn-helix domain-containing protein n=1 Tax=Halosimplex marinum TaxID=3396620 RepID=UPI003F5801F8
MSDAPPPEETLALLGDEYARAILIATRTEPMTADALAEALDAAPSTVYDRIDDLTAAGFLSEATRTDDRGNHYAEYRARLERLGVELTDEGFELAVSHRDRDETAARLHALWSDLR